MTLRFFYSILLILIFTACNQRSENTSEKAQGTSSIKHAKSFDLEDFGNYKVITVTRAWPDAKKEFKYALVKGDGSIQENDFDAVIQVPIQNLVVTSTTHLPSLEMLKEVGKLIGFPNLNYISSPAVRDQIAKGNVEELGRNEDINIEKLIDLSPSVVVGFAMDGTNPTFKTIENSGIPVLYNADWTETTPLGKAEWIKFFGALLDKNNLANEVFETIEKDYNDAKELAKSAATRPTVLSGAMFQDIWHVPMGESWGAQFIADANGDYLWKETKGTGGLALSLEAVLEKAQDADVWIGAGQFSAFKDLEKANKVYTQFKAFQDEKVYTYTAKKNETGGVVYFELAPNRPDLVLKDQIKILHPELLPDYELYFFEQLK